MTRAWADALCGTRRGTRVLVAACLLLAFETPAPAAAQDGCNPAQYRILLDVGHTAAVAGARSARGLPEYEFNLRLAKVVGAALSAAGYSKAFLSIIYGANSLPARSARANRMPADLLLSIHHDSVEDADLTPWTHDGHQGFFNDRESGYAILVSRRNAKAPESERFARALADQMLGQGLRFSTYHAQDHGAEHHDFLDPARGIFRYDGLAVLNATNAPAVVLEAGMIVNRAEELALARADRQRATARAVVGAADAFFCRR